jgi:hypothetical protein
METQKKFIRVKIRNKQYALPKSLTFEELKTNILIYLGYVTKEFIADELIVVKSLNPSDFDFIEAVIDEKYEYEIKDSTGKYFRCKICKQNLSLTTYTCKHLSKCKRDTSRNSSNSLTLSSINMDEDSVGTVDSFLSTSKDFLSTSKALTRNVSENIKQKVPVSNSSCCFDTQDSTKIIQTTLDCDTNDRNKEE